MAAGQFDTELPTMGTAAAHVLDINSGIQADLSSLMARLEPLFGSWQGTASTSFHSLKERWHTDTVKLNDALRGIAEALQVNQRNYATSEDTNRSGFTQIQSVL